VGLTAYVLDASAGVEMLLETPLGQAIEAQLDPLAALWAPEHFYLEVMSTLRRTERHDLRAAQVHEAFLGLRDEDVIRASLRPLLVAAWVRRGHLTVGDAFYVALAEAIGATLVTADLKLAASPHLPVPVITP
jgi:predicted nucleic acid-binding protein